MVRILDAHGLLVFLENEPGRHIVERCLNEALHTGDNLLMSVVNYGEVRYIVLRECGEKKVREVEHIIDTLPITLVDVDRELVKAAADVKAYHRLSYADCFAAALAKLHGGEVITGDPEFETVEDEVKVLWVN